MDAHQAARDLAKRFKEKAQAVQAVVTEITTPEEIADYAVRVTRLQNGDTLVAAAFDDTFRPSLETALKGSNISLLTLPLNPGQNTIHTSVTPADWGIADTGSLVLFSNSEDLRTASMLCDTHIAVLPASRIKPDMAALEETLNQIFMEKTPSYTAFITGASRTADIENVLAIGVHGPKELHILIMQDLPE